MRSERIQPFECKMRLVFKPSLFTIHFISIFANLFSSQHATNLQFFLQESINQDKLGETGFSLKIYKGEETKQIWKLQYSNDTNMGCPNYRKHLKTGLLLVLLFDVPFINRTEATKNQSSLNPLVSALKKLFFIQWSISVPFLSLYCFLMVTS